MKRILFIVAVTVIAIAGFTFFTDSSNADAHEGHDHEEEVDYDNIPLTQKQINSVDIRMGEVETRQLDATIQANGQLVLRAQSQGDVASLMGGTNRGDNREYGCRVSAKGVLRCIQGDGNSQD